MSNAQMPQNSLIDALPDLVVLVRRDGVVLAYGGGQAVPSLMPDEQSIGQKCEMLWPQHVAEVIKGLMLVAIASRASSEASFQHLGLNHEARASAQGPDRALCVIRRVMTGALEEALESSDVRARPMLDRRGFLRRSRTRCRWPRCVRSRPQWPSFMWMA